MLKSYRLFVLFAAALLFTHPADAARTLHVPGDFATVQAAIAEAEPGDTVLVGPGTYREQLNFEGKDIALRSVEGAEQTILTHDEGIVAMGPFGVIDGFTLRDSRKPAISVRRHRSIIENCIFETNGTGTYQQATCIGGNGASPLIRRNIFRHNQGGMDYGSCVIGFFNGSSPRVENNLFHDNLSPCIRFVLPRGTNAAAINNTIVDCGAGIYGGAYVANNIIVGCSVAMYRHQNMPPKWVWENNILFENARDYGEDDRSEHGGIERGTRRVDPRFVDPDRLDFRLQPDSPAIDAAAMQRVPDDDMLRHPRPAPRAQGQDMHPDIGAYEYIPPGYQPSASLLPVEHPQLVLIQAMYGHDNSWVDVTDTIASAITPLGLDFGVGINDLGRHNDPSGASSLRLHYRIGPREYERTFPDGQWATIILNVPNGPIAAPPAEGNRIAVIEAYYGNGYDVVDRTDWIKRAVADGKSTFRVNPITLHAPTTTSQPNLLTVAYFHHGEYRTAVVADGQVLQLTPRPPPRTPDPAPATTLATHDGPGFTPDSNQPRVVRQGDLDPADLQSGKTPSAKKSFVVSPKLKAIGVTALYVAGGLLLLILLSIFLLIITILIIDRRTASQTQDQCSQSR